MYKNILLPVDIVQDNTVDKAISVAVEYAEAFSAKIYLMTCIPDSGMAIVNQYFSKSKVNEIVGSTNKELHVISKDNIPDTIEVQHIVTTGTVYESIINTAKKIDADLIIMSAHRPELKDYLLGPNSARVVRHSNRSVLVVRD